MESESCARCVRGGQGWVYESVCEMRRHSNYIHKRKQEASLSAAVKNV